MQALRIGTLLLAATFLLAAFAPVASAHATKTSADGVVKITWGFLDEPAYAGQKNRLDLVVRDNATNAGIGGLTAEDLRVSLHYGEEEYDLGDISAYRGAKGASAGPGNYTSANPVYLTRPGIYVLHVEGVVNGSPVDLEIPAAHEYEAMEEIMFPAPTEDAGDTEGLEARIAALEAEVAALKAKSQTQSRTPATVTPQPEGGAPVPGLGLVALLAVLAFVALRRKA